jgi:alkaline phosphatase D
MSQFYIPFVRTFYQKNGRYREVKTTVNITAEDGSVNATEIVEKVPEENIIKYLPHGNYKWSVMDYCA